MKTILFSLSVFCFTSLVAQVEDRIMPIPKSSKWSIGWTYSPEFSYRFLSEGHDSDQGTAASIENKNDYELSKFGQSGSLFFGYRLSNVFSLESGIGYTNFSGETVPSSVHYIATENFPELIYTTYRVNQFHVVSVPINLHANFGNKRLRGFFSAGLAPGYLVHSSYTLHREYENGDKTAQTYSTNDLGKYSKFILMAQVSAGMKFQCTRNVSLRIAPVFRMTANSMFIDKEIRGNYYNAGIEVGMIFKL